MNDVNAELFEKAWLLYADGDEISIKPAYLAFSHAGRYSVSFGNQGFVPENFGKYSQDAETGRKTSLLWQYCFSPDVWYYDAEVAFESKIAYDVALLMNAFSDPNTFDGVSDDLASLFDAVGKGSKKLADAANRLKMQLSDDGTVVVDLQRYGGIGTLTVNPARA